MKDIIENLFGFLYTLSMGDYIFFFGTFILILCFVYIIYLIKRDDFVYYEENSNLNEDINYLNDIKETLENEYKPSNIKLTDYEEEQEKNAIISYDELIRNKDKFNVSYDENYSNDNEEIDIKKINIDNVGKKEEKDCDLKVKLMSYDKEEAFLTALKQLQQNLIN